MPQPLAKIGEFGFINRLKKTLPPIGKNVIVGIGDDAAVLKIGRKYLLVTCDCLVEGVHFLADKTPFSYLGRKIVAINVSDIAAMGGVPKYLLLSLVVPKKTKFENLQALYQAAGKESRQYKISVVGGNISRGKQLVIDGLMLGEVDKEKLVLRNSAKPGDKVLVTGTLGDSFSGLHLWQNRLKVGKKMRSFLVNRLLAPKARLKEATIIATFKKATAMIDISDGLASDITHILKASKVGVLIWQNQLPVSKETGRLAKLIGKEPWQLALYGGEDYELCFTVPFKSADKIAKAVERETKTKVTMIGEILPINQGRYVHLLDGKRLLLREKGWNHFR